MLPPKPPAFWIRWMFTVSALVVVFGLTLIVAPDAARQAFSLLVYTSTRHMDTFGSEAVRYVSLTHAVIGAVMVGWGCALLYATGALLRKGQRAGWDLIALSVCTWFVPDTAYSLLSGFWQNALLNAAFFVLFAIPLWATRGVTTTLRSVPAVP